jgi:hypothetical protein
MRTTVVKRFINPPMLVAMLALLVTLGGTGSAVTRVPANSVGARQIINHSIKKIDFGTPAPVGRAGSPELQGPPVPRIRRRTRTSGYRQGDLG